MGGERSLKSVSLSGFGLFIETGVSIDRSLQDRDLSLRLCQTLTTDVDTDSSNQGSLYDHNYDNMIMSGF